MDATLRFELGPNLGGSGRFGIAVTADGRLLAAGGADGTIHLIDPVAGKELRRLEAFPREIQRCHFGLSAGGSRCWTSKRRGRSSR